MGIPIRRMQNSETDFEQDVEQFEELQDSLRGAALDPLAELDGADAKVALATLRDVLKSRPDDAATKMLSDIVESIVRSLASAKKKARRREESGDSGDVDEAPVTMSVRDRRGRNMSDDAIVDSMFKRGSDTYPRNHFPLEGK